MIIDEKCPKCGSDLEMDEWGGCTCTNCDFEAAYFELGISDDKKENYYNDGEELLCPNCGAQLHKRGGLSAMVYCNSCGYEDDIWHAQGGLNPEEELEQETKHQEDWYDKDGNMKPDIWEKIQNGEIKG